MKKLLTLVVLLLCDIRLLSGAEKIRFVLAGDSTVTDDAGWGRAFAELLSDDAECINLAKSGRSSRSYRTEGWWQKCLDAKPRYLLIQFGHNDQPGKGPERESAAETDFRQSSSCCRSSSIFAVMDGLGISIKGLAAPLRPSMPFSGTLLKKANIR